MMAYKDISQMTGGILSINDNELQMTIPKPNNEIYKTMAVAGTAVPTQKVFQATFQGTYFRPLHNFGASRLTGNFQHLSVKLQGTIS